MKKIFKIIVFATLLFNLGLKSKSIDQSFHYKVTVTLKLIEVYVTDEKGNPVTDLTQSDFEIYDNGKFQPIAHFEKHIFPESNTKTQQTRVDFPGKNLRMPRKFFLFFDFAFNNPKGIKKSKEAALHFIKNQLQPMDEVGLLSYSVFRGLTFYEYLTKDHERIINLIKEIGIKELIGKIEDMEAKYWQAVTGHSLGDASQESQSLDVGFQKQASMPRIRVPKRSSIYYYQILDYLKKIKELGKALRYISGVKNIIFFSSGVYSSLLYGIGAPFGSIGHTSFGDPYLRGKYEEMIKELSSSNCRIYTLNVEDLASIVYKDDEMTGSYSLKRLSKGTGGKYFGNTRNYQNIMEEIHKLTSSYYVLGYYIDEKFDGKYHKIKVKVKRKGCKIFAQRGYFNPKPFAKYTELEKKLHLADLAFSEKPHYQIVPEFPLEVLPFYDNGSKALIIAKIPIEVLREVAGKKVEIVSFIFNRQGNIEELKRLERNFLDLQEKNVFYYFISSISPGKYKCRIVIRNLETGKSAIGTLFFTVPEEIKGRLTIYPPLLLIPVKNSVYLNYQEKDKADYLNLLNIFPFDISQYSPLIGELKERTNTILALVRCETNNILNPEIKIYVTLINEAISKEIPLNMSIVNHYKKENVHLFLLNLYTDEFFPGNYLLNFLIEELNTGIFDSITSTLIINYKKQNN